MASCFTYMLNGEYDPNAYHIFAGSDAAVAAEWTVLTVTTPGIKSNGDVVVFAQEYNPVVISTPPPGATAGTIISSGTIVATYGSQPAEPRSIKGGDSVITLVNGANNDVAVGSFVSTIQGPTGAFNITGIAGGVDGKMIHLLNNVAQNMTITNDSSSSLAANRIYTYGTVATTGVGTVTLVYSGPLSRWVVTSLNA